VVIRDDLLVHLTKVVLEQAKVIEAMSRQLLLLKLAAEKRGD